MSDSMWPHRRQPTRLPHPWDSPGGNTGVGCHFLLQCVKVKSESKVAQSCPTLSEPMDCSPPGSSIHGTFQARGLEWGAIAFSRGGWEGPPIAWIQLTGQLVFISSQLPPPALLNLSMATPELIIFPQPGTTFWFPCFSHWYPGSAQVHKLGTCIWSLIHSSLPSYQFAQ